MASLSSPPKSPTKPIVEYKPKCILVTGGAGFIASHVVILLAKKYPEVKIVNFDCLDYCSCIENLDEGEFTGLFLGWTLLFTLFENEHFKALDMEQNLLLVAT